MPNSRILLQALKYTVLTFASIHLFISYTLMLFKDFQEGNLFRIIALDHIWPQLDSTVGLFVVSQVIWLVALAAYCIYLQRKESSEKPNKKP